MEIGTERCARGWRLATAACLCLVLAGGVPAPARAAADAPKAAALDEIVLATVNGETITRRRLAERLLEYRGEDALEKAINRAILFQEARRLGLSVSEEEVRRKMEELRRRFQNESDYRAFLTRSRLTETQLAEEFRNTLLLQKVALREQPIAPADLEQYDVSVIVVGSREAAEGLVRQLEKGANFAELAARENSDLALRQARGRMRPFLKIEMLDLARAVDEQKLLPSQYTKQPVALAGGKWALVRLERRIPAGEAGLERDRLEAAVTAFRVNEWVARARQRATVRKQPLSEGVVATVNGEPISRAALVSRLLEYHGEEALEQMVNRVLLLQAARQYNVSVTAEEVEQRVAAAKAGFATPEAFQAFLTRTNLSEQQFRDELRYTALMEKVALRESPITDEDLQRYEVRMIVAPGPAAAEEWVRELNDGADFAQMAFERCIDPKLRQAGGRIPPFLKIEMLDLWRAITEQKLQPGQYTKMPILLTDNSWVLLKLENILPISGASKEERERLAAVVTRYRVEQWLQQARARAKIAYPTQIQAVVRAER